MEYAKEKNNETGWQFIKDMVRGTVVVNSVKELWDAYEYFKTMDNLDGVISIDDDLDGDFKKVTIIFSHYETLIGEIVFRYGEVPAQLYSNIFLTQIERAKDV